VHDTGIRTLALVTATVVGIVTAMTMIGPLLLDLSRELGVSLGQTGLLAAAMALPWSLGAPFAGLLSDRLGRRPLIVLALGGIGAASLGGAFAPDFPTLLATRFVAGLFGAFGPASLMAAVGDLFPPQRRGMAMGWLNMGFGLAAVAGVPLVGAVGGLVGWRWAFAATGLALIALAGLVRLAFPASRPPAAGTGILATYRAVLGAPRLANVLGANLLERAIFNAATLYLPPFLMLSYGLNAVEVAPSLALVAVGTILGNALGGWLGDRFLKPAIFVVAQILAGAVALALFGLPVGLLPSALGGALFGLANAASRPAFLALGSELSIRHRGAVLGLLSLTNQGGVVAGSALGGLVIALGGYSTLAAVTAAGAGLAAALALPLATRKNEVGVSPSA
jgi:DHA1 family inner membrane transport protein